MKKFIALTAFSLAALSAQAKDIVDTAVAAGNFGTLAAALQAAGHLAELYEAREFGKAMREIMALTDAANQYVDSVKPWELAKQEGRELELHAACSNALNLFRLLTVLLKPILPVLATRVEQFLNVAPLTWNDTKSLLASVSDSTR